jgi:hypothetical protein
MALKQYIGISRDHSGSMGSLTRAALKDYNDNIAVIKEQATAQGIDTVVSVVKCGVGPTGLMREVVNSSVTAIAPLTRYEANGGTPLFDSVGELIDIMTAVPDANDPNVSFLVMVITDGEENQSKKWSGTSLSARIRQLQATDRWTFVFRVPFGYGRQLAKFGIPAGNILEWDQTDRGVEEASASTREAFTSYYKARSTGVSSTKTFYADLKNVTPAEVKAQLNDISPEVTVWQVFALDAGRGVKDFVEGHTGKTLVKGTIFYQLTKTEKEVQDYKKIVIREKSSGLMYTGPAARTLLGLPTAGKCRVVPGDFGAYDVFVQSTSLNRKLVEGSSILLYERAAI